MIWNGKGFGNGVGIVELRNPLLSRRSPSSHYQQYKLCLHSIPSCKLRLALMIVPATFRQNIQGVSKSVSPSNRASNNKHHRYARVQCCSVFRIPFPGVSKSVHIHLMIVCTKSQSHFLFHGAYKNHWQKTLH
jgi:hypothetical protein